jgi:hypothetical protein
MNFIKNKVNAIIDFVPFVTSMSFLIFLRNVFPKLYNYIETNHANNLIKTDGNFKTIVPNKFLQNTTSNCHVIKSIWDSFILTIKCPAKVGMGLIGIDLPIVKPQTYEQIQLSDVMTNPNKYYVLNFGSSS